MSRTVAVLGAHRTGSSCVTHILHLCGLYLGDRLMQPTISNLDGYWESLDAVEINDSILAAAGGAWDSPPPKLFAEESFSRRIRSYLDGLRLAPVSGWKDPRTTLTFPIWKQELSNYALVVCLRNPTAVSRSLAVRENWSEARGLALWCAYYERLLDYLSKETEVLWFDMDRSPKDLEGWIEFVCPRLGLGVNRSAARTYNRNLRHHDAVAEPEDHRAREIYRILLDRSQKDMAAATSVNVRNGNSSARRPAADAEPRPVLISSHPQNGKTWQETSLSIPFAEIRRQQIRLERELEDLSSALQKQYLVLEPWVRDTVRDIHNINVHQLQLAESIDQIGILATRINELHVRIDEVATELNRAVEFVHEVNAIAIEGERRGRVADERCDEIADWYGRLSNRLDHIELFIERLRSNRLVLAFKSVLNLLLRPFQTHRTARKPPVSQTEPVSRTHRRAA